MSVLVTSLQDTVRQHAAALKAHAPPPLNRLRMLALELGNGQTKRELPAESELQRLWAVLQAWIDSKQPPRDLSLSDWKHVPALFWWKQQGQPIIANPRLRTGILWAASMSVPRIDWINSFAEAYLEAKDVPNESHQWLGNTLKDWCAMEIHDNAKPWRRRHEQWALWSPQQFPVSLAKDLFRSADKSLPDLLNDVGLTSPRAEAGSLSEAAFIEFLRLPASVARGYYRIHFERVVEWQKRLMPESSAWPKALAGEVINGLLEPWSSYNPPDIEFQKMIQQTLIGWFGSVTERWTGLWSEASASSREVWERWKVLDVMEAFFQRVDDYARLLEKRSGDDQMRRHWQYRRPFWLSYYQKGVVTKARALIGRGMLDEFKEDRLRREFGKAMARFESRTNKHHCALLLEINGLLVIDLSHNGKAYFFLPSNNEAPSSSAFNYHRDSIEPLADESMIHQGSENYAWQGRFAKFIDHHTGIHTKPSDYHLHR